MQRKVHNWKTLGYPLRSLSSSLHVLAMSCESNDVDKAEIVSLRIMNDSTIQLKKVKDIVHGYLRTIREVTKTSGMKLFVDRACDWPFICLLRSAGEE